MFFRYSFKFPLSGARRLAWRTLVSCHLNEDTPLPEWTGEMSPALWFGRCEADLKCCGNNTWLWDLPEFSHSACLLRGKKKKKAICVLSSQCRVRNCELRWRQAPWVLLENTTAVSGLRFLSVLTYPLISSFAVSDFFPLVYLCLQ